MMAMVPLKAHACVPIGSSNPDDLLRFGRGVLRQSEETFGCLQLLQSAAFEGTFSG